MRNTIMPRKTLTILSLIGLLLSVGLWGVSYYRVMWVSPSLRHKIDLSRGAATLQSLTALATPDDWQRLARRQIANTTYPKGVRVRVGTIHKTWSSTGSYTYFHPGHSMGTFQSLSTLWTFSCRRLDTGGRMQRSEVRLPLWISTLAFGSVLYFCRPVHFHRRRKRRKLGLCVKCGYDLRGSKDRCPECGQGF